MDMDGHPFNFDKGKSMDTHLLTYLILTPT